VLLLELFAMSCSFNCQLIAVKFDGDVLRAILLHVECKFVLITLFHFKQDGGLS